MDIKLDKFPKTWQGFYWLVIKHFPRYFCEAFVLDVLIWIGSLLIEPLLVKWNISIFENAVNTDWNQLYWLFVYIGCYYLWNLFMNNIFPSMLYGKWGKRVYAYSNLLLNYRVYNNDTSFFINNLGATISNYTRQVTEYCIKMTVAFWSKFIGTIAGFALLCMGMGVLNWRFVVLMAIYGVFKILWQWFTQKKLTKHSVVVQDEKAKYSGRRMDSLSHALLVKIFANTEYENQVLYKGAEGWIHKERKQALLRRYRNVPTRFLWYIMIMVNLVVCFNLVQSGVLTIANAMFVMSAITRLDRAISDLNLLLLEYHENRATVKNAYAKVVKDRTIIDKPHARILREKNPDIVFDNVSFSYGDKNILKNLSLTVAPKEKVGIVGLSGAGKTTLCNLLMRMYDVGTGTIKISGMDIRDIKHESLLKNISYVPQETELFNRTVMDNIKYAKPHASDAVVIKAAKAAHIHEKISKLPNGYDTLVGNNGYKFSGGERQRISIARALLKDAPIVVLDEATSAMDSQNELAIQKSLQTAMHGKTALVIAHRLSTLRNMDKIIVLKNGKIVEVGSHKQLLRKKDGVYKKLWSVQTGGFIA